MNTSNDDTPALVFHQYRYKFLILARRLSRVVGRSQRAVGSGQRATGRLSQLSLVWPFDGSLSHAPRLLLTSSTHQPTNFDPN